MSPEKTWMATVCEGSVSNVLDLYQDDAVLVATFAPAPLQGKEAIGKYFQYFIGSKPMLCGAVLTRIVQAAGPTTYVSSGLYEFQWAENGRMASQKARYTFVWKRDFANQWKVLTQHSSVIP